jgi:hypothetical protein
MPWQSISLISSLVALFLGGLSVLRADKATSKVLMERQDRFIARTFRY